MSEYLHFFSTPRCRTVVALPFTLTDRLEHWSALRREMVREVPATFTRDEWAYLVSFLSKSNLEAPFLQAFGNQGESSEALPNLLIRPRGTISIWLPNTVSLLGPLTLVLATLSGAPLWIKVGSRADDLTTAFVDYAVRHLPAGQLKHYLQEQVRIDRFDRNDPLNSNMASAASVRVAFGSDAAIASIHQLPHPVDSVPISFGDHCSEAWLQMEALTDETMVLLIRTFAIYGRAGCTSPRRFVVLGGSKEDALCLQQRLKNLWPKAIREDVPMHLASLNIMNRQLALAEGWEADLTNRNSAVVAVGASGTAGPSGLMTLAVVSSSVEKAIASLPRNIQTIGHCLKDPRDPAWLRLVARTKIKRFVPISEMHHFGPIWDGSSFWRGLFEEVVLSL